jgi:hypothetical protein
LTLAQSDHHTEEREVCYADILLHTVVTQLITKFSDGFPTVRAALMKNLSFFIYDASSIIKQLDKIGKEHIPFFLWTQIFQDNLKLLLEANSNM